jgi:hypothetical protein
LFINSSIFESGFAIGINVNDFVMGLSVNDVTFQNSHNTYPNGMYKYMDYLATVLDGRVIPSPHPPKSNFH